MIISINLASFINKSRQPVHYKLTVKISCSLPVLYKQTSAVGCSLGYLAPVPAAEAMMGI